MGLLYAHKIGEVVQSIDAEVMTYPLSSTSPVITLNMASRVSPKMG